MNMLIAEYDYDVDIAVQREEEREIALQEGIVQGEAKGFSLGIAQGKLEGISEGSYKAKLETAKLMKHTNCKRDFIMQMTGLTKEEVESIS
ncbi:hypothetical protein [Treponema sp. Marseille-Q4130]|uniref:hypothetical protein n=1 Tax=Treponema sp. Marseille-Q4130 TaxID=2766702 RepID=UPI002101ED22|nr:hypothetical protein [Treponema sp. Marseille-Q4130]